MSSTTSDPARGKTVVLIHGMWMTPPNPNAVTKVDYRNPARPPLLFITGREDRISPPSVNRANLKK